MALDGLRAIRHARLLDDIRGRNRVNAPRTYYPRIDQWIIRDSKFRHKYRLSKAVVRELVELVREPLERPTRRGYAIPVYLQVLAALRYYDTGSFQDVIGELNSVGLSQPSVSRIVRRVSVAIAELRPQFIQFPAVRPRRARDVRRDFHAVGNFPNVIGAIDGTHIPIANPGGPDADLYINRKSFRSLNVQVVCDSQGLITNIVARWPGSCHDSRIFAESRLGRACERGNINGYLLGDNGYPCLPYLMTPLLNPRTAAERRYNVAHKSTRRIAETNFGRWKRRFPCLSKTITASLDTAKAIIVAVGVLHNLAIMRNDRPFIGNYNILFWISGYEKYWKWTKNYYHLLNIHEISIITSKVNNIPNPYLYFMWGMCSADLRQKKY